MDEENFNIEDDEEEDDALNALDTSERLSNFHSRHTTL